MAEPPPARPEITAAVTRGAMRVLIDHGFAPLLEVTLANGRRADVMGVSPSGEVWIVEVKSGVLDYLADGKWPDYADFCDAFWFAVPEDFPIALLPESEGYIVADAFGGAIVREAARHGLNAARRKALLIQFARLAALRLAGGGGQSS